MPATHLRIDQPQRCLAAGKKRKPAAGAAEWKARCVPDQNSGIPDSCIGCDHHPCARLAFRMPGTESRPISLLKSDPRKPKNALEFVRCPQRGLPTCRSITRLTELPDYQFPEHSGGRSIKRASALAAKLFHNPHLQAAPSLTGRIQLLLLGLKRKLLRRVGEAAWQPSP
jgi:hypothetical protein